LDLQAAFRVWVSPLDDKTAYPSNHIKGGLPQVLIRHNDELRDSNLAFLAKIHQGVIFEQDLRPASLFGPEHILQEDRLLQSDRLPAKSRLPLNIHLAGFRDY
jgi:hypothetical protein